MPNNTAITTAQSLPGGNLTLTAVGRTFNLTGLPPFCRVNGVTKPGPNSNINWEVWMPASGWNGRFEQFGGGAINGSINLTTMGQLLQLNMAVAATDGGSTGQFADFVNNSDRQLDFAYRAYPATHDNAIPLIEAFYGRAPTKSYFVGCSEGGREALLMAQRYPTYFDGIQAGSPAKYPSHMWIGNNIWLDQLFANPNNRLSVPQINLIQNSSTAACAAPGTGVVADPRKCNWDVGSLLCTAGNTPESGTCLSSDQVATMKVVLDPKRGGVHNPRTGKMIFPGVYPFSGLTGLFPVSNENDSHILYIGSLFYNNLNWPWQSYNFDSDQAALDAMPMASALAPINPDLSAFAARGGKLMMWAGWEDTQIFAQDTVNFFEYMIRQNASVTDRKLIDINYENPEYPYGNTTLYSTVTPELRSHFTAASQQAYARALGATNQFATLHMASGVNHCGGGPGAQSFIQSATYGELTQALVNWVENGVPPGDLTITKRANNSATGASLFTTLLCSYPKSLTYRGSGDLLSASSYVCQ